MKRLMVLFLLPFFAFGCGPAPTPIIVVVTVVVPPTIQAVTNTPTSTPNPCMRWDQVTSDMVGQTSCVRGIIRRIEASGAESHWDFTDNRTGFFAISSYLGWHPVTGKDMSVGDCVAITGLIQVISNGRPYIYWGANSRFKSAVAGTGGYYEHPDLQVIENNPSFCQ